MKKYSLMLSLLGSFLISTQAVGMLKRCAYVFAKKSLNTKLHQSKNKKGDLSKLTLEHLELLYVETNPEYFRKVSEDKYKDQVKTILDDEFKRCAAKGVYPRGIIYEMYYVLFPATGCECCVEHRHFTTKNRLHSYCHTNCKNTCKDGCIEGADRNEED